MSFPSPPPHPAKVRGKNRSKVNSLAGKYARATGKENAKGEREEVRGRGVGFRGAALKVGKCKVSCGMIPVTGVQ